MRPPSVAGDPKRSEGPPLQKGEARLGSAVFSGAFLNYDTVSSAGMTMKEFCKSLICQSFFSRRA
ncbi:hypothetical protein SBDP1_190037 [Syntrophobacter sp. SbD1]|nr:hypothetical protein SBDP1_190037 [Syntrophobacter sp. SbD1]